MNALLRLFQKVQYIKLILKLVPIVAHAPMFALLMQLARHKQKIIGIFAEKLVS
jgi:hypothetical protein